MKASIKYYALIVLVGVSAGLTYVLGQPQVTENVLILGVVVGVVAALHDLEGTTPGVSST